MTASRKDRIDRKDRKDRSEGWRRLLAGAPWLGADGFPIPAYSEFMPPPRLGQKPLGELDTRLFSAGDPWGWQVNEYEEGLQLRPGLEHLAGEALRRLRHLGRNETAHGISRRKLRGNPYWPEALQHAGAPAGERFVLLLPLALSRTQDDKGRVRWTLFGGSEQGPARAFWRGFWSAPDREVPAEQALAFLARLLSTAYGEPEAGDPRRAGLRLLPCGEDPDFPYWREEPLPSWTRALLWDESQELSGVRYLLTFRPFARLPEKVQSAYVGGELALLPFPGSLLFWGAESYRGLARELPLAMQVPLLQLFDRHEATLGLRVLQSGWLHEPRPGAPDPDPSRGPMRNLYRRTHRWARMERHEDELEVSGHEDRIAHVLFSCSPRDLGLYGKPMARNAQLWTASGHALLDGPRANRKELAHAAAELVAGGLFGYRFLFPAMRVGCHEVYWHRPLAACWSSSDDAPAVVEGAPLGYLTAYASPAELAHPGELWPRLLARPAHRAALAIGRRPGDAARITTANARKLLEAFEVMGGQPLERGFAQALLTLPRKGSLARWLTDLPRRSANPEAGRELAAELGKRLGDEVEPEPARPLTFGATARRSFEAAYWRIIAMLATGRFRNKDNADCVLDPVTQARLAHRQRDLEALGDYLLDYYEKLIARAAGGGAGKQRGAGAARAVAGDLPFNWRTDFDFSWSEGWLRNRDGETEERDVVMVIPGRDRGRAVVMADHYDTAYMEDVYGYEHGGGGPRLAAAGADDNHSATAALMLAAPIFLAMSQAGQLATDVWLVHLTGEEFPSDCLGARHLARCLVEGRLRLRLRGGGALDLSATEVVGVYVLDMVAHNNDRVPDVFQICPGLGLPSLRLACHAHLANRLWNAAVPAWNRRHRRGCGRGRRSADGRSMPATALHPELRGEVRPAFDPRSTLYNTDGQIFSDAGIPVVLFMENYDINRHGYHDSHDTLENIDLDYGAALTAIAIETVARVATGASLPAGGGGAVAGEERP